MLDDNGYLAEMSNSAQTVSNPKSSLDIIVSPKCNLSSIPKAADCKESWIMDTLIPFAHRTNPDASIDSICTTCFQTIASEDNEVKLIDHEERHSCDPYWGVLPNSL